jgi:hypothetical protein
MLFQNLIGKNDQLVVYASRFLNKTKQNYNTTKRKALAMVLLCTSLDIILWARSL